MMEQTVVRMASPPMVGAFGALVVAEVFFPVVPARAELRMRLGSKYRQA